MRVDPKAIFRPDSLSRLILRGVQAELVEFRGRTAQGRSEGQAGIRRNHSMQYFSHPESPCDRLRRESPGVYESYTDLEPGAWTRVRIVVRGVRAELFVGTSDQPCPIVNDLKLGDVSGGLGLWIGSGTEAHFSTVLLAWGPTRNVASRPLRVSSRVEGHPERGSGHQPRPFRYAVGFSQPTWQIGA